MSRKARERAERELVYRVVAFAQMPRPLDSAAVLDFVQHPWFAAAGDQVILGTEGGTTRLTHGFAVTSLGVLPPGQRGLYVATVAEPPRVETPVTFRFDGSPTCPKPAPLIPSVAFGHDQREVRDLLRCAWEGRWRDVEDYVDRQRLVNVDLVRSYYDWETGRSRLWVATVQGACTLALNLLRRDARRPLAKQTLASALRWCEACGPWFPDPDKAEGGRPGKTCGCGRPLPSYREQRAGG